MQHEFTHVGSNAVLNSHECGICGLVVALTKSQPLSSLPLDGCCARSEAPPAIEPASLRERPLVE